MVREPGRQGKPMETLRSPDAVLAARADARAPYDPPVHAEPASLCSAEQKRGDAIGKADTMAVRLRPSPRAKVRGSV